MKKKIEGSLGKNDGVNLVKGIEAPRKMFSGTLAEDQKQRGYLIVDESSKLIVDQLKKAWPRKPDAEKVHDAYLEVKSDPEKYSAWQNQFVESLEFTFNKCAAPGRRHMLTKKEHIKIDEILTEGK